MVRIKVVKGFGKQTEYRVCLYAKGSEHVLAVTWDEEIAKSLKEVIETKWIARKEVA